MNDEDPGAPLAALRAEIDGIDDRIASLLDERARVVVQIAKQKRASGLPSRDERREALVMTRLLARAEAVFPAEGLRAVYREIMRACLALHDRG